MPISDFLHRATTSKGRGSSTPRSQCQSTAPSTNSSDRDDEQDLARPGPSSAVASPVRNGYGFPDEKCALSPETQPSTLVGEPPAYRSSVIPREDVVYTFVRT
ncbi:hypothetical protein FRC08_012859, partial [Ceratobasidium sp. 394]